MGTIGYGYGSEWHLLRYLGYHRGLLTKQVQTLINGEKIDWLDFDFTHKNEACLRDREWDGLDFIEKPDVQRQWHAFWPTTGRSQNWDAVAKIAHSGSEEWLLVEAKGHIGELKSECKASSKRSKEKIRRALDATQRSFGAPKNIIETWLNQYYQTANRLAALHFLNNVCQPSEPAHLLFIYFYGDQRKDANCPQSTAEWQPALAKMDAAMGLDRNSDLYEHVHHMFLPVNPKAQKV